MLSPSFYSHAPPEVELRETHASWVMLAGERAYKVKKPVRFSFLDYGTLERRHELCREEVRANRRLAPDIYLRVLGIARDRGRYRMVPEDDPAAIEYVVEMCRVEEDRSLEALIRDGRLEPRHVDAVARRLARFHADAEPVPPARCVVDSLTAPILDNIEVLREIGPCVLGEEETRAAEGFTRGYIAARGERLTARCRDGFVRDCHGDLRGEHVIVPSTGDPYVFDCIEFNPDLRQIDVSSDLAFLAMDMTALGARAEADRLVAEYRRAGGDPGDDWLLGFYAAYRAWVRVKVALLRAAELEADDPDARASEDDARELFRLGRRYAWRARGPLVLVVCGVAASGKTSLATEIASLGGLEHISSDVTRKRLAGIEPTEPARPEHYSEEFTRATYRELGRRARDSVESAGSAVVDATFHLRGERAAFLDGLGELAAPTLFLECEVSPQKLLARARERSARADSVSDAGEDIVRRQLEERDPLDELPASRRARIATDDRPDRLAALVERLVDARLSGAP